MATDTTKITGAADELSAGLAKGGTAAKTLGAEIANAIKSLDGRVAALEAGTPVQPPIEPPIVPPTDGAFDMANLPFAASSLWNKPIPSGRNYGNLNWVPSDGWNYGVTWSQTGYPVYQSQHTDPVVQVTCPASWGWPANQSLRIPAGVTGWPGAGSPPDNPLLVIDDNNIVHNWWRFVRKSDTTATAGAYGCAHVMTDTGFGGGGKGAGTNAIGASMLGGLLVQKNTDTGDIKHALQLAVAGPMLKPGHVPPAIGDDGHSSTGIVQEGQLLGIAPGTAMPSGLSPLGQKLFRCMQQYGVYVCDHGGDGTFLRAQANAYNQSTMDALRVDANTLIRMLKLVQ